MILDQYKSETKNNSNTMSLHMLFIKQKQDNRFLIDRITLGTMKKIESHLFMCVGFPPRELLEDIFCCSYCCKRFIDEMIVVLGDKYSKNSIRLKMITLNEQREILLFGQKVRKK